MIFVKDAKDLRFVMFNKAGEELIGVPARSLLARMTMIYFRRIRRIFSPSKDRKTMAGGKLLDIPEEPLPTKHQGERILHTKKIPVLDQAGNPQFPPGNFRGYHRPKTPAGRWKCTPRPWKSATGRCRILFSWPPTTCRSPFVKSNLSVNFFGMSSRKPWGRRAGLRGANAKRGQAHADPYQRPSRPDPGDDQGPALCGRGLERGP